MSFFRQFDPLKIPRSKVELHVHLDGCPRLTTVWELAQRKGINLGVSTFEGLRDACTITQPSTLANFLKPFGIFMPTIIGDRDAVERVAYEMCEDAVRQGVAYFEARFSPHLMSNTDGLSPEYQIPRDDPNALTPNAVVDSVARGLQRGEQDFGVKARSILCCIRSFPEKSEEVLQLCQDFRDQGVVAIDIAGDEAACFASPEDAEVFQRAAELGIHRTVHAGEAGPAENVMTAIRDMQAERIGHGYHSVDDDVIYHNCLNSNIHFEACPYSSYLTGSISRSVQKHPIVRFAEDEANFSISRDDPTIVGTVLDDEYELLRMLGLREVHIARANFNAARSCFLPAVEKEELLAYFRRIYGIELPPPRPEIVVEDLEVENVEAMSPDAPLSES